MSGCRVSTAGHFFYTLFLTRSAVSNRRFGDVVEKDTGQRVCCTVGKTGMMFPHTKKQARGFVKGLFRCR